MRKTTKGIMLDGMHCNVMMFLTMLTPSKMLRFSERDLMMRYHWGLGVGHLYAHGPSSTSRCDDESDDVDLDRDEGSGDERHVHDGDSDSWNSDHPEFSLQDREAEGWEDVQSDNSDSGGSYGDNDADSDGDDAD